MNEEQEIKELPKGWQNKKLNDIGIILNGDRSKNYPSRAHYVETGIPFISAGNIEHNIIDTSTLNYITQDKFETLRSGKLEKGDIIYCLRGSLGKCAIFNLDHGAISSSLCILRLNDDVQEKFAYYYLCSPKGKSEVLKYDNGTAQPNLSAKNFANYSIVKPPIEIQQQIVSKIEELFSELDKGIEELKTAQQQLKVYRQAVLKWAFEGRLTNEDVKEGELPEGWSIIKFGELFSGSPQNGLYKPSSEYGSGLPIIRIDGFYDGVILNEYEYKRVKLSAEETKRYLLSVNDILINRVNSMSHLGKCGLVKSLKEQTVFESNIMKITVKNERVIPQFITSYLSSKKGIKELTKNAKHAVNQASINQTDVSNTLIPICSLEEQQQIVQEIESRLSVCDKIEETITNSLKQAEALRQSILKKAFEGKLIEQENKQYRQKLITFQH